MSEPLGASQVLPYLRSLSPKYRFTIISFEKDSGPVARDASDIAAEIEACGNMWVRRRYHKGGIPSKIYDVGTGRHELHRVHRGDRIALVHARGYVPAAIASLFAAQARVPFLFDIRGLQAEESVDAGQWSPRGFRFRITKAAEASLFSRASGIVTLTHAIKPFLAAQPGLRDRAIPWEVIPCCVDLDHFRYDAAARARVRAGIGVGPRETMLVYSGSIGTWYSMDLAARVAKRIGAFLLVLTFGDRGTVARHCAEEGLPQNRYAIRAATRADMPAYLSAADVAISAVKPSLSKLASSPTKIAEALACGLPVLSPRGIGDLDALAKDHPSRILLFSSVEDIPREHPWTDRQASRSIAEIHFSLPDGVARYDSMYRLVL